MQTIITPDQCRVARRELGLSQADVSAAVGINRQYISEYEGGYSNRITVAQLRKLRAYFEEKLKEANDNGEPITLTFGEIDSKPAPESTQTTLPVESTAAAPYRFWPVFLDVPQPTAAKVLGMVQDNDARIAVLLKQQAEKESGSMFSDGGEFTASTVEALQEAIGLFAANYALFRSLSGWSALGLSPSNEDPETLRDVIFATFQQQFEAAGLLAEPATEKEDVA